MKMRSTIRISLNYHKDNIKMNKTINIRINFDKIVCKTQ